MPIVEFFSSDATPPESFLEKTCIRIQTLLHLQPNHVWSLWHTINQSCFYKPGWNSEQTSAPIVKVRCKSTYSNDQVQVLINCIAGSIVESFSVASEDIYIVVDRVHPGHLFVREKLWSN